MPKLLPRGSKTANRRVGRNAEPGPSRDLSADNELPALLEEFETLQRRRAADKERLDEIKQHFRTKLGDAARGALPGWEIFWVSQDRRAYEVPAQTVRYVWAERTTARAKKPPARRKASRRRASVRARTSVAVSTPASANGAADEFFDDKIPI
jgi:hypothetical protein